MIDFARLPKAELHVHIEGTFEPELIFALAHRNAITLPYRSIDELRAAYRFSDLQAFLNVYYAGMNVLRVAQDYYDLAIAYLRRAHAQSVRHAEIFFDPQAHVSRGIALNTVIDGLMQALRDGATEFGITTHLIPCFLRDRSAESAMTMLDALLPHRERIVAVGLDSAERGNPPSKFTAVFARAREAGFLTVAHAGEEGPPAYVWEALDELHVSRIDHGIRAMEDPELVERLRMQRIPLTVCPLSNLRLHVTPLLCESPLKRMLAAGLVATVNSDDPAYFGGYIDENFAQITGALALTDAEVVTLAQNSFEAAFIDAGMRRAYLTEITTAVADPGRKMHV